MCLATPGKIIEVKKGKKALVDFQGLKKEIDISLVKASVGDWVIVHAGFAIEKIQPEGKDNSPKSFSSL
jgi:hydrogenase expression/formation protein HypC